MRIEDLFKNLSLKEKNTKTTNPAQCFSIEIHKLPEFYKIKSDSSPRRRKRPKVVVRSANSSVDKSDLPGDSIKQDQSKISSQDVKTPNENINCDNWSTEAQNSETKSSQKFRTECSQSTDSMVSIEIGDNKGMDKDSEMDFSSESTSRCIKITIKDDNNSIIFEKQMMIDEHNIKIKPFLLLIDEF